MNRRIRQLGMMLLATGIAAACGTAPASPAAVPDKAAGVAGAPHKLTLVIGEGGGEAKDFADAVADLTDGRLEIDVEGEWRSGRPDYETAIIKDVATGTADIGMVGIRAFDVVGVDAFQGFMAPFLVDNLDVARAAFQGDLAADLLDELRPAGVVGVGYRAEQMRRPIGVTRDFTSLADFRGATFGIRESKVSEMTAKALGATPKVVTPGSVSGLDGLEGSLVTVIDNIGNGVRSATSNVNFWPRYYVIFVNAKTYDALSADQQQSLRGAAATSAATWATNASGYAAELHGVACRAGLAMPIVGSAELAELRAAVEPVYQELEKNQRTKDVIAAIRALRAGDAPPQGLPTCPDSPAPEAAEASPIDGVWTTSFTKDELVSSPFLSDGGEVNDGNWGDFELTMDQGRVRFTQHNAIESYTTAGTFSVDGDVVTYRYETGGNALETFTMRWSLFQDTLSFQRDGITPTPYLVKPWTRTG
jgi:TRAP-type C4-dicarboxylate transport system substrate-binding protein